MSLMKLPNELLLEIASHVCSPDKLRHEPYHVVYAARRAMSFLCRTCHLLHQLLTPLLHSAVGLIPNAVIQWAIVKNNPRTTALALNHATIMGDADISLLLNRACALRHAKVVLVLLQNGASPSGSRSQAPLHISAFEGDVQTAQHLLDYGADPNAHSPLMSETVLSVAARRGHVDFMRLLIRAGADIEKHSGERGTALHAAVISGVTECVQYLFEAGASATVADKRGRTPLMIALRKEPTNEKIVQLLLQYGADKFGSEIPGESVSEEAQICDKWTG